MIKRATSIVVLRWRRFFGEQKFSVLVSYRNFAMEHHLAAESSSGLVRTIGRWSLAALIVNR